MPATYDVMYGLPLREAIEQWPIAPADDAAIKAWFAVSPQGRACFFWWKHKGRRESQRHELRWKVPGVGLCEDEREVEKVYIAAAEAVERRRTSVQGSLESGDWVAHWSRDPGVDGWEKVEPLKWQALTIVHKLCMPTIEKSPSTYETRVTRKARVRQPALLPQYVRIKADPASKSPASTASLVAIMAAPDTVSEMHGHPIEDQNDGWTGPENKAAALVANAFDGFIDGEKTGTKAKVPSQSQLEEQVQLETGIGRSAFRKVYKQVASSKPEYRRFAPGKRGRLAGS
jgi:hypothetical protein